VSPCVCRDAGALSGDVGNRVVIARDARPCRQLSVEPSHARFGMSAGDVSGLRDLSAPALPEGRKIYEMIRDRPKQFELHPPIRHLDHGSLEQRRPEERRLRMKLFDISADGDGFGDECAVIKFEQDILPIGFLTRYLGVRFSPFILSTSTVGNVTPFSARKMRTRLVLAPDFRS
jgi:hypothetical protein